MCNSFSGIIKENGDVIWYFGVDSHEDILEKYNSTAQVQLTDLGNLDRDWVRFEVTPTSVPSSHGAYFDYFNTPEDSWEADLDESLTPLWFTEIHRIEILKAHKIWYSKLKPYLNVQKYNFIQPKNPVWSDLDQQAATRLASLILNTFKKLPHKCFVWDDVLGTYEDRLAELVGKSIVKQTLNRFKCLSVPEESLIALTLDCFNLPESFWTIDYCGSNIITEYPLTDFLYLIKRGYYVRTSPFDPYLKVSLLTNYQWLFDSTENQVCKPEEV